MPSLRDSLGGDLRWFVSLGLFWDAVAPSGLIAVLSLSALARALGSGTGARFFDASRSTGSAGAAALDTELGAVLELELDELELELDPGSCGACTCSLPSATLLLDAAPSSGK